MTPFAGHPIVVGVTPDQPELVVRTAAAWASALGVPVWFAYADPTRLLVRELADGTVQHEDLSPDAADDSWRDREGALRARLADLMGSSGVPWEFRYLAGRPDRALTHLARLVDAAAIVVGTKTGRGPGLHELLEGAVGQHLAHHQHRPVLLVPLAVVDWKTPLS
ncbi:universal stress protein [Propioniciclava sp.]|uniref:universal stress protein n=1 Tax=Propioniciclava sp. TaxID=2038686 RepID=UPI002625003B|nr:universal stress protein [Propioniciclava sp.]